MIDEIRITRRSRGRTTALTSVSIIRVLESRGQERKRKEGIATVSSSGEAEDMFSIITKEEQ
jgi:hypothetical protein